MSNTKQRDTVHVTVPDPELTTEYMGDVSMDVSTDTSVNIGYAEDNSGLWFRIINTNGHEITVVSSTPGASSTPVVDVIEANEKSRLYIAIGDQWTVSSSLYEEIELNIKCILKEVFLKFYNFLYMKHKKQKYRLCCLKF